MGGVNIKSKNISTIILLSIITSIGTGTLLYAASKKTNDTSTTLLSSASTSAAVWDDDLEKYNGSSLRIKYVNYIIESNIGTGSSINSTNSKVKETAGSPETKSVVFNNGFREQSEVQKSLYNYLMIPSNREKVKNRAKSLNGGDLHNACVYFTSEALRRVGVDLSNQVNYTGKIKNEDLKNRSLTYQLLQRDWKVERDVTKLLPGDICFTTCSGFGSPTHAYIFMGWVKEGSCDYAYICDNQIYDYGNTYHIRNVKIAVKGKEPFSYFMYKS